MLAYDIRVEEMTIWLKGFCRSNSVSNYVKTVYVGPCTFREFARKGNIEAVSKYTY